MLASDTLNENSETKGSLHISKKSRGEQAVVQRSQQDAELSKAPDSILVTNMVLAGRVLRQLITEDKALSVSAPLLYVREAARFHDNSDLNASVFDWMKKAHRSTPQGSSHGKETISFENDIVERRLYLQKCCLEWFERDVDQVAEGTLSRSKSQQEKLHELVRLFLEDISKSYHVIKTWIAQGYPALTKEWAVQVSKPWMGDPHKHRLLADVAIPGSWEGIPCNGAMFDIGIQEGEKVTLVTSEDQGVQEMMLDNSEEQQQAEGRMLATSGEEEQKGESEILLTSEEQQQAEGRMLDNSEEQQQAEGRMLATSGEEEQKGESEILLTSEEQQQAEGRMLDNSEEQQQAEGRMLATSGEEEQKGESEILLTSEEQQQAEGRMLATSGEEEQKGESEILLTSEDQGVEGRMRDNSEQQGCQVLSTNTQQEEQEELLNARKKSLVCKFVAVPELSLQRSEQWQLQCNKSKLDSMHDTNNTAKQTQDGELFFSALSAPPRVNMRGSDSAVIGNEVKNNTNDVSGIVYTKNSDKETDTYVAKNDKLSSDSAGTPSVPECQSSAKDSVPSMELGQRFEEMYGSDISTTKKVRQLHCV